MKEIEINISSSTIEKGLDKASGFLSKLIKPSIEEVGLLWADNVKLWRVKNLVKVLAKSQEYCEKNNVSIKQRALQTLFPLLENASLEEDDFFQDKWANLLSNMVDSEQNIENNVFPYILSQLSKDEFLTLEQVFCKRLNFIKEKNKELEDFRIKRHSLDQEHRQKINEIDIEFTKAKESKNTATIRNLRADKDSYESKINRLSFEEMKLVSIINDDFVIPIKLLKEFELANLIRLGLAKENKNFYANSQRVRIPNKYDGELDLHLDIDIDSDVEFFMTDLGKLFMRACIEKTT
jgi:hypothetical protein